MQIYYIFLTFYNLHTLSLFILAFYFYKYNFIPFEKVSKNLDLIIYLYIDILNLLYFIYCYYIILILLYICVRYIIHVCV